tara:strand:+ start:14531 stop:14887 length:357 start_codon:yes stop_codon:yes gene_type:complete
MTDPIPIWRGQASPFHLQKLDETSFCAWVAQAKPGDALEYHRGFLCLDRGSSTQEQRTKRQIKLDEMAERALELAERGFVHLLQQRVGEARFRYLAIARPCPEGQSINFSTLMTEEAA